MDKNEKWHVHNLQKQLKRLIQAFYNYGFKVEFTITELPKIRRKSGYTEYTNDFGYIAYSCPNCKATQKIYGKSVMEVERPYSHTDFQCGLCGHEWKNTKILD